MHNNTTKRSLICIALIIMSRSSLRRSGRARVSNGLRSLTCHRYVHPKCSLPLLPGHRTLRTSLWLVLISRPTEGRRLSWPGGLGEILRWFIRPKTVTLPRGGVSRKSDALTRKQTTTLQDTS